MSLANVLLAAGAGSRFGGTAHKLRSTLGSRTVLEHAVAAMIEAPAAAYFVVVGNDRFDDLLRSFTQLVVVENAEWERGQASTLRAGIAAAEADGHDHAVVGVADQPFVGVRPWIEVGRNHATPIAVAAFAGQTRPPVRLAASVWGDLPESGDEGARVLLRAQPGLVTTVDVVGYPVDVDTTTDLDRIREVLTVDAVAVEQLLGRVPQGRFDVAVRATDGSPVVLRNAPVLDDGRPMPTMHWLCGAAENVLIGRLESAGGVRRAERDVGIDEIDRAHRTYAAHRDAVVAALDPQPEYRPSGGVGGTRTGVKCLHAHYAWWLAGGPDPVGQWVHDHLHEVDRPDWPAPPEPTGEHA